MNHWLNSCESWILRQYQSMLQVRAAGISPRLRWLTADSLTKECNKEQAQCLAIEDAEIGWLFFLAPFDSSQLERQVNEALGIRSRLLKESNYTGRAEAADAEDPDSSWRVGLVWLVAGDQWAAWQHRILELRRESGAAEEISLDAIPIDNDSIDAALDAHGLPRLLIHTRALFAQSATEVDSWLSADSQVSAQLENFSHQFESPRVRALARQLEEQSKLFQAPGPRVARTEPRRFKRFRVKQFRNLEALEVVADQNDDAQAIVLYGPNGTGKSSFAEALSLAAFASSPRLDLFLRDTDFRNPSSDLYFKDYLKQCGARAPAPTISPSFSWNGEKETHFATSQEAIHAARFEGVILNQEDSIKFTELSREALATLVLKGYSAMTDHLISWLSQEERRANETKLMFTRKYEISGVIKKRETAYDRLAQGLLKDQLHRPSPEFLGWLDFFVRLAGQDLESASRLASAWRSYQATFVTQLAGNLSSLQAIGASQADIAKEVHETLDAFNRLAEQSKQFHARVFQRIGVLREQLDQALSWIDMWGTWLATRSAAPSPTDIESQILQTERETLAKERSEIEGRGQVLRGRLELLEQAQQFLTRHWAAGHPNTCPVCNSNVENRQGIEAVVGALRDETNANAQALRTRHADLQERQKELDAKLKSVGAATCPVAAEDQARLKNWLAPFLPDGQNIEGWLVDQQRRQQLKSDLGRMRALPEAPLPYSDPATESHRLANEFIALSNEADRALDDPQAMEQVRKTFEQRMEAVLVEHLPKTLGKVWQEITLTLTTAPWLLPARPILKLDQRGKSLSVQLENRELFVRYIYNAAERHVLGLAWFFTCFLAKRRFEEAWMLLDDPAQEMDQPSFRELVRFWETLLRIHRKNKSPLTLITTLHQEERALDATRGTNGRLYVLGWQRTQDDSPINPTVKKVVLLAPGYHPLKPEKIFG